MAVTIPNFARGVGETRVLTFLNRLRVSQEQLETISWQQEFIYWQK
jgi:hypothetical protein